MALILTCWKMLLKCSRRIDGARRHDTVCKSRATDSVFSVLRTGRLPRISNPDVVEFKFNHWHDPTDGRFTFVGSGHYHGGAAQKPKRRTSDRSPNTGHRGQSGAESRGAKMPRRETPSSEKPTRVSETPQSRSTAEPESIAAASRRIDPPNPVAEFAEGVGEGLYRVGAGTVTGVYSILTTNPITTVQNVGIAVARTIDAALVADATPTTVHIARAATALTNASVRDWGRSTGLVAGNVVVAAVPGAVISKVSALRSAGAIASETVYKPLKVHWAKEHSNSVAPWKAYNDAATGAQVGYAPAFARTMADGSIRLVKFDGVFEYYVIDRKSSIRNMPRARAQVSRQADVLAQHNMIGFWEVPTPVQRVKALQLLKKRNVTNIGVRVIKL
ncbi:hypothetical protein [Sphingomonas sp. PvP056]|uniref:hypothetical protein n=1 Tax=Sphingomonas sp. PvP056 TaxID=3156392 RepID=UPI00339694D0